MTAHPTPQARPLSISGAFAEFRRTEKFWKVAVLSLPLDLLIAWFKIQPTRSVTAGMQYSIIIALIAGLLLADRRTTRAIYLAICRIQDRLSLTKRNTAAWLTIVALAGICSIEAVVKLAPRIESTFGILALSLAGITGVTIYLGRDKMRRDIALARDRQLRFEQLQQQYFLLINAPLLLARGASFAAAVQAALAGGDLYGFLPIGISALVILLLAKPDLQDIKGSCRSCAIPMIQILSLLEPCAACAADRRRNPPQAPAVVCVDVPARFSSQQAFLKAQRALPLQPRQFSRLEIAAPRARALRAAVSSWALRRMRLRH